MVERKDTLAVAERKARPILFSGEMVRALLAGSKTQTRRIVKPQPADICFDATWEAQKAHRDMPAPKGFKFLDEQGDAYAVLCPYGQPGDLLWVRETALEWRNTADGTFSHVAAFAADGYELEPRERWTPSIHMPRRASRLTLRITEVRVERLQEISEADALAEGALHNTATLEQMIEAGGTRDDLYDSARDAYEELWNGINGAGSWESNPWCWCLTFEPIRKNVDDVLRSAA